MLHRDDFFLFGYHESEVHTETLSRRERDLWSQKRLIALLPEVHLRERSVRELLVNGLCVVYEKISISGSKITRKGV